MSKETKFQSVASFCSDKSIKAISDVRVNKNGYPFVTMISDEFDGGAENVYFSIAQSKNVKEGQSAGSLGLADLTIAHTENEAGEARLKITSRGESAYTDVADLLG